MTDITCLMAAMLQLQQLSPTMMLLSLVTALLSPEQLRGTQQQRLATELATDLVLLWNTYMGQLTNQRRALGILLTNERSVINLPVGRHRVVHEVDCVKQDADKIQINLNFFMRTNSRSFSHLSSLGLSSAINLVSFVTLTPDRKS